MSDPATLPAFDPDSADATILAAFEEVRQHKVWIYSYDDQPEEPSEEEYKLHEDAQYAAEKVIDTTPALTLPGIAAKLLLDTTQQSDRWYDRALSEHGVLAALVRIDELDGTQSGTLLVVRDLIRMDWEMAIEAYERSVADFDLVLTGKGIVEEQAMHHKNIGNALFLESLEKHFDAAEDRFSNAAQIKRLVRTLTPDHAAFLRKVDIIIASGVVEDVTPWLARDASFLVGACSKGDA